MQSSIQEEIQNKDWRILLGLAITVIWLVLGFIYISGTVGWAQFGNLPIDELGTFLEGAFAPLAFLWLVIGLFIQQTILAENNRELRRNNLQSEKQTQAIAATELNARQETFFKISDNTRRQLGGICGMLYLSSQGPPGDGPLNDEQMNDLWQQFASGDTEVFSRRFLYLAADPKTPTKELFYGTAIRMRHSNNFIVGFDRLLRLAKECDTDTIIQDALIHTAHGLLVNRMRELHPQIRFSRLEITDANTYLKQIYAMGEPNSETPANK